MNQRLVESVAQIVLSMSNEERRLLERNLQECGLHYWAESEASSEPAHIAEPEEIDKSARIAELAQDIQLFEARHHSAVSPTTQWTPSGTLADASLPLTAEINAPDDSPASLQSFFQLTQAFQPDTADDLDLDYAVYQISRERLTD